MNSITTDKSTIEAQIARLESQLTGDMFLDMPVRESLSEARKQLRMLESDSLPPRPLDSDFECIGCGS